MLPLCKFYRYLIYRLYHFCDDMPVLKVVLTLSFIHYVQLLIIVTVIEELFPVKFSLDLSKNESILFFAFSGILHYFLFYNKEKWRAIEKEFKGESTKHKKIGLILVLIYLLGTIIFFFTLLVGLGMYHDSLK